MATDGRRKRYSRMDNGVVFNTRELAGALQRAREEEDTLKSKVARVRTLLFLDR